VGIDDVRLDCAHRLVGQAEPRQRFVSHRGDEHVAGGDDPGDCGAGHLGLEIEHDRSLVAVEREEIWAHSLGIATFGNAGLSHDVTARILQLDDVRALIAENLGGICAIDHAGEVENPHARERAGRLGCAVFPVNHRGKSFIGRSGCVNVRKGRPGA
jgi:hypothetical protein